MTTLEFGKSDEMINSPEGTLNYNDFYWTNLVVSKDKYIPGNFYIGNNSKHEIRIYRDNFFKLLKI